MKLKHIAIIGSLFPILFSVVLFFGVLISADSDDENSNFSSGITGMNLSAEVLKHQPMVEKYAREYGISEYINVLLAIIQVESGGTAEDVMQSSESLGLPPNSLDTESSIKQGCKYFASLLSCYLCSVEISKKELWKRKKQIRNHSTARMEWK